MSFGAFGAPNELLKNATGKASLAAAGAAGSVVGAAGAVTSSLAPHVSSGATFIQQTAAKSGVTDFAAWGSQKLLVAGSHAQGIASVVVKEKISAEWGSGIVDMLFALVDCMGKLSNELKLSSAKFGLPFAIPLVHIHHDTLDPPKSKGLLTDGRLVSDSRYWVDYASAAYGCSSVLNKQSGDKSDQEMIRAAFINGSQTKEPLITMAAMPARGVQFPGHYVAVDYAKETVVLAIRGTSNLSDALTDAVGHSVDVTECPGVKAHAAMLASARLVLEKTRPYLNEALKGRRYGVVVTGHSLGAATAMLCTILLKAKPLDGNPRVVCFAYAPPPSVAPTTASAVSGCDMYAFVNRTDIVPRASVSNIFRLGQECMAVDQLDLTLSERLNLIKQGTVEDAALLGAKQKVVQAVTQTRRHAFDNPHNEFPALFVPGDVFWIEWLGRPGGTEDASPEQAIESEEAYPARIHKVDTLDFQELNIRGGKNALTDHSIGAYVEALDLYDSWLRSQSSMCNLSCTIQ
eukprot:TRINITY_DN15761_c0_g1_i1.p1 TRINITY_DN15761_c0_g1~~TRINITY_DN15761_c0_g1_i1.p1  ORF type:complete len:518 (+),score=56.87 TRINITY_DN15761_c0_g1_i1:65-1618(+)